MFDVSEFTEGEYHEEPWDHRVMTSEDWAWVREIKRRGWAEMTCCRCSCWGANRQRTAQGQFAFCGFANKWQHSLETCSEWTAKRKVGVDSTC